MTPDSEKMIAELVLQVGALNSKIDHLEALLSGTPVHKEGWMSGNEAAAALKNEGVRNALSLQRLRLAGVFSEAREEILDTSKGKGRPTWTYNVPKCRLALQRHFKKLRSVG